MLDAQHDVVVSDLVTTDVDRLPATATIEATAETAEAAAADDTESTLAALAESVSLSRLISLDMRFDGMLDALRAEPAYFVGWTAGWWACSAAPA